MGRECWPNEDYEEAFRALSFLPVLITSCDGSHPKCTDDFAPGIDFLPLPVLQSSCDGSHPKCTDDFTPDNDFLPLPDLHSSCGSHPNCMDDLPPGSFVTLEVVRLPSTKTFWFSFIPYDMVGRISGGSKWEGNRGAKRRGCVRTESQNKNIKNIIGPAAAAGRDSFYVYRVEFVVLGRNNRQRHAIPRRITINLVPKTKS
jgi:hypothetical protein